MGAGMNLIAWMVGTWRAGTWKAGAWKGSGFIRSPWRTTYVQADVRNITVQIETRKNTPVS